jgi:catechol 2,3-dioxygenase-like lactoylglutathione lyase family enzyme
MRYQYVSQLSHVEVTTSVPQASLDFFTDVLGMQASHQEGQAAWLRACGEFFHQGGAFAWYLNQVPEPGTPPPPTAGQMTSIARSLGDAQPLPSEG